MLLWTEINLKTRSPQNLHAAISSAESGDPWSIIVRNAPGMSDL